MVEERFKPDKFDNSGTLSIAKTYFPIVKWVYLIWGQWDMKISTKGRYALRTLIDLAQHSNRGLVALKDIAGRQEISQKYLEQIVTQMSKAGFLKGVRGPQGGYRLARAPQDYNVAEILEAIEGSLAPVSCLGTDKNECDRCGCCSTLDLWEGLYKTVMDYLSAVSLQDLVDRANERADSSV